MATADVSTLTIRELTGLKREVVLRGPSLPFQGAPWGGQLRVVTTWYPGNAMEATQHVLGPMEKSSSWEGVWRTTQMFRTPVFYSEGGGSPSQLVRPFTLMDILEDVFRQGQRLSVEWQNKTPGDTEQRRIVREGRCVDWEFKPDRSDDIYWSIEFDWASRGARQQKVLNRRTENLQASMQSVYQAAAEAGAALSTLSLVSSNKKLPLSADQFSLGDLENLLNYPTDLMQSFSRKALYLESQFQKIGDMVDKVRRIPSAIANQALDVATNAINIANQFADQMSRRPPEANLASQKTASLVQAVNATSELYAAFGTMRDRAAEVRKQVLEAKDDQGDILAVHITRGAVTYEVDGETKSGEALTAISQIYYSTVDHAADIAKANGLPLNQGFVERGTVLIIPRLDSLKGADVGGV